MMQTDRSDDLNFEKIYEALYPLLFNIAYRITGRQESAEDICHDAFIKYYELKLSLPDLEQTKYWLIRVVKNISLNYEKKKSREKKAYSKFQKIFPHFSESGEDQVIKEETRSSVQKALNKLPYNLRIVIVLKEYSGLNYKQIGSILGISEGNVKIRVFRARKRLSRLFDEDLI